MFPLHRRQRPHRHAVAAIDDIAPQSPVAAVQKKYVGPLSRFPDIPPSGIRISQRMPGQVAVISSGPATTQKP
jgi:hypothetical protein